MSKFVFSKLERSVYTALKTYSNVHRGIGHNSIVTTALYDYTREITLEHLNLDKNKFTVVFCSPYKLRVLKSRLKKIKIIILSSRKLGLPLGLRALVVEKNDLSKVSTSQIGGGGIKMVFSKSAILADIPERFESGTPNVINTIALTKALQLSKTKLISFKDQPDIKSSVKDILYQDDFLDYIGIDLLTQLRKTLIGQDNQVPTIEGERSYINFDNAASTPTFKPIWDVVCQTWRQPQEVLDEIVKEVIKICLKFVSAPSDKYSIIFSSNTTEAINFATQSIKHIISDDVDPVIITTVMEHHSNELPWRNITNNPILRLSIDKEGNINLDELKQLLSEYNFEKNNGKKRIKIVTLSAISNVLGRFYDLKKISQITHKYGAYLFVDGAQLIAHRKTLINEDNIDFFAFSGHKIYAPFGSGALIIKKELMNLNSQKYSKIRQLTEENVIGIASIGKAMILLQRIGMNAIEEYERQLAKKTLTQLYKIPNIKVFGIKNPSSPKFKQKGGIIVFSVRDVPHNVVGKELAECGGIGVRTGCFCAHILIRDLLKIHPARTFSAGMGQYIIPRFTDILLPGLVRISFGIENDEQEICHLIKTLKKIVKEPRTLVNKIIATLNNGSPFLPITETEKQIEKYTEAVIKKVFH
ncbi:MAG: aminotransferase class V-fold PLP-dependent enzyme [Candidatus Hodarchaeales archaeon]|jgi:selenocysteine lyase/cysteine desulfurase